MRALLLFQVLLLVAPLYACPAGYESPESLVRHARLIVQLEVLSVEEAPLPPEVTAGRRVNDYGRLAGKARVKVVQVIKGECATREFTLVGGPYHTCAPYLMYHAFSVGEKYVLILESPLPPKVKTVAITWRNRIIKQGVDEVKKLMKHARVSWKLAVERHRRAVPVEFAQAERLHAEYVKNPTHKVPPGLSYGVLSCLAVLSNDPDHLPPVEADKIRDQEEAAGYRNSLFADFYQAQGAYVSAYASQVILPTDLRQVFRKPADLNYTPSAEANHFNKKILKTILEEELLVSPGLSSSILENPKLRSMWDEPQRDIIWLRLDRPRRDDKTPEAMALYYLMLLADPEPDGLVWGTFGQSFDKDAVFLPTDLFVGFLGHKLQRLPREDASAPMILARLPHPQIAPLVRAYAKEGAYNNSPEVLISYFVRLGFEPDVLDAVGIMEKNVDEFIKSMGEPEGDPSMFRYRREHYLEGITKSLGCLAAAKSFETSARRLGELAQRVKAIEIKLPLEVNGR